MAGVYKGLTIKIGADTTGLSDALNKIDSQSRSLKRNMSAIDKALKLDPKNTELARQKMEAYQKEIQQASKRLETLKAAESQIGKDGMSTEAWDTLQREIATTEGKLKKLAEEYRSFAASQSGLGKAGAAVEEFGRKLDPIGQKAQSIGKGMTAGVTLPIIAASTASVKAAVDIDTALTDVKKTVDGTAEDYQALKDAAIEFSKVNAVSAADLLSIESLGAQLGYTLDLMSNGKSEVQEFGEVVSGLDIATNMSAEQAGQELAQFFNIMGESKEMTENYGSTIVGLGNNFATTESDISAMSMRIAGAGKNIGLSSADVLGLATALTSLGINAEAGGTAVSTVMSEIDKAVALGNDDLETWAATARMSAEEFKAAWSEDAVGALDAVLKGMGQGVEEGGNLAVMLDELGISSLRQTDMMKRLANSGDLMSRAVARANEEWERNDALSNEVANRNDSLAAKFEMLRNRVIAVAEEVGAPLADAMLAAVDAAEPLFEAIENGARAFSEMDEGEQRAIINTVALVAMLGPGLKAFSKVTGSVQVLGGALTKLSQFLTTTSARQAELALSIDKTRAAQARHVAALGTESAALKAHEAQLVAAEKAERRMAAASKASAVAMNVAKGVAFGLALAGIAVLVSEIQKYVEHQQKLEKATTGLKDATSILDGSLSSQSGAFDNAADSAKNYRDEVDKVIESNADLAGKIEDTFTGVMGDAEAVQMWADRVRDAKEAFENTPESLAALQAAVNGWNSATGDSVSIINAETGELSKSTDELQRNADAWIANAKAKAAQDMITEAVKGQVEAEVALADAHDAVAKSQDAYNQAVRDGDVAMESFYGKQLADAEQAEREAQAALDARAESVEKLNGQYERYTQEAMLASQTTDDFRNAIEHGEDELSEFDRLCGEIGRDADNLAGAMTDAEISTGDFANVGADAFRFLYEQSGKDMSKVKANIDMLQAAGIDPKTLYVDDDGTIKDCEGRVIDLDNQRINDKSFAVKALDWASSVIDKVRDKLKELPSEKQIQITQNVSTIGSFFKSDLRAAGGISPLAAKRIPRHANGGINGIVTRATLTSAGIVGEAGAEYLHDFDGGTAIVPIQNSRYVRPLAHALASEIGGGQRAVQVNATYNIYDVKDPESFARRTQRDMSRLARSEGR